MSQLCANSGLSPRSGRGSLLIVVTPDAAAERTLAEELRLRPKMRSRLRDVRGRATWALGLLGRGKTEVVQTLLSLVDDRGEDAWVRAYAAEALGKVGQGEAQKHIYPNV
jgi:HEAT repeat protein